MNFVFDAFPAQNSNHIFWNLQLLGGDENLTDIIEIGQQI